MVFSSRYFCLLVLVYVHLPGSTKATITDPLDAPASKECPEPQSILPCVCIVDGQQNMDMDCSAVANEEELKTVFGVDFPSNQFRRLTINGNQNLKTLRVGDLGTSTFQEIWITDGVLEWVMAGALSGSFSTAEALVFNYNSISNFPFSQLESFTKLLSLDLRHNNLRGFPSLKSTTLGTLYLTKNPLGNLPVDAFRYTPVLSDIQLSQIDITEVASGTFSGLPHVKNVALGANYLTSINENTISFNHSNGVVDLGYNNIQEVAANAFPGFIKGWVYIHHNHLTELTESAWGTLLNNEGYVDAYDNPLRCGCAMAWLIRNSTLLDEVDTYTTCANGVLLRNLDPADYADC